MTLNLDAPLKAQWAYQHAIQGTAEAWNELLRQHAKDDVPESALLPENDIITRLPKAPPAPDSDRFRKIPTHVSMDIKVGIVGAGAAGLFTAMVFDYLNDKLAQRRSRLKFVYEIIEAAEPDRVGGRLFSYNFGGPRDTHDYYDVGAMRFPDNPVMTRTFDLFKTLKMNKVDLKTHPNAEDGSLITYYMNDGGPDAKMIEPWCYNNINLWGTDYPDIQAQAQSDDPFKIARDGSIPPELFRHSPDDIIKFTINPIREALKKDAEQKPPGRSGWDLLMRYDRYSTRGFLGVSHPELRYPLGIPKPPYNYDTIEWLETFNGGTSWYDQAHSETVLESIDFEFNDKTNWYCVLGGAQELAKRMERTLARKPTYGSRVTAIKTRGIMNVSLDITKGPKYLRQASFNAVFNSTALGCMRHMDLREAGLSYPIRQAIRSLGYGTAAKVAIKFKKAWWIHDLKGYSIKKGGLGHSDLALRTCVYPSYNIYDSESKTAVLLCSYTWQQDSQRLASLISNNKDHNVKVSEEYLLKELLIRDLATLHRNPAMSDSAVYRLVRDNYVDHHAFDWSTDPNAAGAFAFFRPQQFSSMWSKIIQPSGDIVVVGEAASPHHAWVVGALESVVHGVYAWLGVNAGLIPEFFDLMRILEKDEPGNPFVGLPPYMDKRMADWHSRIGMLHRETHLETLGEGEASPASLFAGLNLNDPSAEAEGDEKDE